MERVGQIEHDWTMERGRHSVSAGEDALMRLALLQSALRRRLLATLGKRLLLNRRDPCGGSVDFSELDPWPTPCGARPTVSAMRS